MIAVMDRRDFLLGSLAGTLAMACGGRKEALVMAPEQPKKPMKLLILGGTGFLGPHIVEAALARGHQVTLFNRGKTRPGLFPTVEKLHGDRDGKLEELAGKRWDVVIDPSGYVPRIVKMSAALLAPSVERYIFISTISVYDADRVVNADETAKLYTLADPTNEDVKANYGALKAASEAAAEAAMPKRVAIVRPGLIVGPGDPTGRFTHWPTRIADGGEVLAPGDGSTPVQWIDGRDLGAWLVRLAEQRTTGTFNAFGPAARTSMRDVLETCNAISGGKATLTWVPWSFLDAQQVQPWSEMPMWIDASGDNAGFGTMQNARAIAAGLTFRSVRDTARDTLAWLQTLPDEERAKVRSSGITREKEAAVLAAWHASTSSR